MMALYNIIGNIPYVLLISVLVMLFTPSFWTMVFCPDGYRLADHRLFHPYTGYHHP